MGIRIRRAVPGDAARLVGMLRKIAEYHRRGRPDVFVSGSSKYDIPSVREKIESGREIILVAAGEDDVPVGYAMAVIKVPESPHLIKRKIFYLDDLFVEEEYRRSGVGHALLEACEKECGSLGCDSFELNVWRFPGDAYEFYTRHGFTVQRIIMERQNK